MEKETFIIKKQGNYFVAYDTVDKKRSYGKINIDTGKFAGDTRCLIVLSEFQEVRKQELIDKVIEQFKQDINEGDLTAIDGLLQLIPIKTLKDYLPE